MKVYCINFQGIAEGQRTNALVWGMFNLFRRLDINRFFFLTGSIDKDYGPNIQGLNRAQLFEYKLFAKVSALLKLPYYIRRTVEEKIVDAFFCKRLKKENEPFILITTMYAVRCTCYAKKHGCTVLFWAGNLNDNLYYETVKKEQKRLGLHYTDVYTSLYRIGVYRKMFENVDFVYCLNSLCAWSFSGKRIIMDSRPLYKAPLLYPKEYVRPVPDKIVIGYFGHTTLLKGVHLLGEAIPRCKYRDKIELVIAGSVDKNVKRLLLMSDVPITFLGSVPEGKKWSTIQSFDFMVVPSLYDAGPGTIAEAYKCDVPVIVSSGCGNVEKYKDDPKCVVFRTMDIQDLADKIDEAYKHRETFLRSRICEDTKTDHSMSTGSLDFFNKTIEYLCSLS